jgi:CheY-like chemotaxis protein
MPMEPAWPERGRRGTAAPGGTAPVVLMDLRMPVMDGLQAARAPRDRGPTLPVIILSAYEDRP